MDKKIMLKLSTSIMALVLTTTLVVTTSYAWLTLAGSPEVDGIQITIGGSNTILVAADQTVTGDDGAIYHYPGAFGESLNFLQYDSYDYLKDIVGLKPVSTSDGVYWFLPDYYEAEDSKVQSGQAYNGQLKDISEFIIDSSLEYANLTEESVAVGGHYAYMDFWVASPAEVYQLRVSTGSEEEGVGSYVIALPKPTEADADADGNMDSYVLQSADETVAASVRVGFLVNGDGADTQGVLAYLNSRDYNDQYTALIGQYQDPGEDVDLFEAAGNRFTIYEPNGDLHPALADSDALGYHITKPLGWTGEAIEETDVSQILSVQKRSFWKNASTGTMIGQEFQTAIVGKTFGEHTLPELKDLFYRDRLAGQLAPYMNIGRFIANTGNLCASAKAAGGQLEGDAEVLRDTAGATNDVYITTLRKNMPQRIRMFIWIEGQDGDCTNHAATDFAVNIELAGSNET